MPAKSEISSLFHTVATWRRLDDNGAARAQARLGSRKGRQLTIRSEAAAPSGVPVRIDMDGALFLGEVTSSRQVGDEWDIRVDVEHMAHILPDLVNLMTAVGGAPPRLPELQSPERQPQPVRLRKDAPSR